MNKRIEELLTKAKREQQLHGTDPFEKFAELNTPQRIIGAL
jgi:hypothetical protein